MTTAVYDPDQVSVIFAGLTMSGYAEDEFVKITKNEDTFLVHVGADGSVTRSKNANNTHKVSFMLATSSKSNALLSAIHEADRLTPGGSGIAPCLVLDGSGNSLFAAPECWLVKPPEKTYAKQANTVEWEIFVANPINFVGGN